MIEQFSVLITFLVKIFFQYLHNSFNIVESRNSGTLKWLLCKGKEDCGKKKLFTYFKLPNIMKRRRVSNLDQNKVSDGSTSFPSPPVAAGNNSPCILNTVFEVLLPLEPKISQNQSFEGSNILNPTNNLSNKMFHKNQYNLCKKCGGLEEYCECVASGDFENVNTFNENVSKTEEKPDNLVIKEKTTNKELKTSEEYLGHNTMADVQGSLSESSFIETDLNASKSLEQDEQNITGNENSKDYITSETDKDLKSEDTDFIYEEINESNNVESENDNESISQSYSDLYSSKDMKSHLEKNDQECISHDKHEHEEPFRENLDDTGSICTAVELTKGISKQDILEESKEINVIKEASWEKSAEAKSSTTQSITVLSTTHQSTTCLSTLRSECSEHPKENNLQIFEQMDLDDIQLELPPKLDSSLLEEIREAEKKSRKTAHLINQIKSSIKQFQSKENLTEEDALVIKIKQVELAKKLAEFEDIARRVQNLVGIVEMNDSESSAICEKTIEPTVEPDVDTTFESKEMPKQELVVETKVEQIHVEEEKVAEKIDEDISLILTETKEKGSTCLEKEEMDQTITEEIEEIQTQSNLIQKSRTDKMSYLGKDTEVTNFLMMDKIIPKVIVCGSQDSMPRVIVCEKPTVPSTPTSPFAGASPLFPDFSRPFSFKGGSLFDKKVDVPDMMISLSGRLSESYLLQEKLASENAALEDGRYILQEELLKRDNIVDALQKKVGCLQNEMRIVAKENLALQEKLEEYSIMDPCSCVPPKKANKLGQGRQSPGGFGQNNATNLERQLNMIEGEVRTMQSELQQVQKERQQLEQQRKLLKCTSNQPVCVTQGRGPGMGAMSPSMQPSMPKSCACGPIGATRGESPELQLRELREQYVRLEDDFKNKVAEVSTLRREVEKWKCKCEAAKEAQEAAEEECRCVHSQLKSAEQDKKKMLGSREQMMEQEQQLNIAKQRFREAQDELDELRALIQDQTTQLEDYRNKYLQAQQQVEEQRRQIDVMEMENSRISDQVNLEIQRVKAQFQEKLQELTPLPDILKATQMKLQECQQARLLSERNCEELAVELQSAKEQLAEMQRSLEMNREDNDMPKIDALQEKVSELKDENGRLRSELIRLDEIAAQAQRRLEEKSHDAAQLAAQLDTVREESARQVARTKDRAETMRRSLQCQISEMERQLAQSRAAARSAQKDRDEIRQRMQCQINNLNESFEQAQLRIRSLQSHVNFLKSSYSNIFEPNCPNLSPAITECACPTGGQDYNF